MTRVVKTILSKQNREISLLEEPCIEGKKTILFIGVFHGDEPQGEFLIKKFLEKHNKKYKNKLYTIPCLNPDGKAVNTRQNSNGVDINRNFPTKNRKIIEDKNYFSGDTPASEVETRFMIEVLEQCKPDMILSLHAPYRVVNYDGPAKEVAMKISEITGYPVEEDIGYETPGSFGTYAGKERNIPVITLELPEDKSDEDLWVEVHRIFDYCVDEF